MNAVQPSRDTPMVSNHCLLEPSREHATLKNIIILEDNPLPALQILEMMVPVAHANEALEVPFEMRINSDHSNEASEDSLETRINVAHANEAPEVSFEMLDQVRGRLKQLNEYTEHYLSKRGILLPTYEEFAKELKQLPYVACAARGLVALLYTGFLGVTSLNSIAAFQLLVTTRQSVLDPTGANLITNAGGLLGMFADLPAITYLVYLCLFQQSYHASQCNGINESYHLFLQNVSQEYRETLYEEKMALLGEYGIMEPFLHPDDQTERGKIHAKFHEELKSADSNIRNALASSHLIPMIAVKVFKELMALSEKRRAIEAGKLLCKAGFCIGLDVFAAYLFTGCGEILYATSYSQMFSSNTDLVNAEANYFTNIGTVFESIVSVGVGALVLYSGLVKKVHRQVLQDTASKNIRALRSNSLTPAERLELDRIETAVIRKLIG